MTTDLDTLLTQALALVSEDRRGQLADLIEQIITQAQAAPQKVYVLALDADLTGVVGVFTDLETLKADAFDRGFLRAEIGGFMVKKGEAANG